jgi:hypothetical protein
LSLGWSENFWWRRRFHSTGFEDGQVVALRDGDDDCLVLALVSKMMLELHPQHASLRAHDIVFSRVVAGRPAIDVNPDLRFSRFVGLVFKGAPAYVQQKRSEPGGFLKSLAGGDPMYQFLKLTGSLGGSRLEIHQ